MRKSSRRQGSGAVEVRSWWHHVSWWQLLLWGAAVAAGWMSWTVQVDITDVPVDGSGWWIFSGNTRTIMHRVGAGSAVVLILIPAVLAGLATIRATNASRREADQIERRNELVNGVIAPLAAHLGRLAHLPQSDTLARERLAGAARQATLSGLFDLLGAWNSGVRVCFYRMEQDDAGTRRLVPEDYHGCRKKPHCTVYEGDGGRGNESFAALDARDPIRWYEGKKDASVPAGWTPDKDYKAIVGLHVSTEQALFGMVSIDATHADTIRVVNVETLQTVADLYAAILAGLAAPKDPPDASTSVMQ